MLTIIEKYGLASGALTATITTTVLWYQTDYYGKETEAIRDEQKNMKSVLNAHTAQLDMLFYLRGCGRITEQMMSRWESLKPIAKRPEIKVQETGNASKK